MGQGKNKKTKKEKPPKPPSVNIRTVNDQINFLIFEIKNVKRQLTEMGAMIETLLNLKMVQTDYVIDLREQIAQRQEIDQEAQRLAQEEFKRLQDSGENVNPQMLNLLYRQKKQQLIKAKETPTPESQEVAKENLAQAKKKMLEKMAEDEKKANESPQSQT